MEDKLNVPGFRGIDSQPSAGAPYGSGGCYYGRFETGRKYLGQNGMREGKFLSQPSS